MALSFLFNFCAFAKTEINNTNQSKRVIQLFVVGKGTKRFHVKTQMDRNATKKGAKRLKEKRGEKENAALFSSFTPLTS